MTTISAQQVAQQIAAYGGSPLQQQVGAALVSGVESNGDPTELAGGIGPAAGLFQFEPPTWLSNGGGIYAPVAQDATWQQQVAVFVNASRGNNFGAWGPDLGGSYGYSGPPKPGSPVADKITGLGNVSTAPATTLSTAPTTAGGGQAGAPYTPSSVPGIPATPPPLPDFTLNPGNEVARLASWYAEFGGWAFFTLVVFLFGAILFLLGAALLVNILAGPAVGPIAAVASKRTPTGKAAGLASSLASRNAGSSGGGGPDLPTDRSYARSPAEAQREGRARAEREGITVMTRNIGNRTATGSTRHGTRRTERDTTVGGKYEPY